MLQSEKKGALRARLLVTLILGVSFGSVFAQRSSIERSISPDDPPAVTVTDPDPLVPVGSPVKIENTKPGTSQWQITNPATNHEIEGFADRVSVNHGDALNFYVSTSDPTYQIRVFRIGWYDGLGGREMTAPMNLMGVKQVPPRTGDEGAIECDWFAVAQVAIQNDWLSGVYLTKLTGSSGKESYIIFVVRDDANTSDLLFQTSVATYQAYNNWGGKSLYNSNSVNKSYAHKVSFNRPYARSFGAGDFLFWEIHMLRFLEREGYDVTYSTDVDTHERGDLLLLHRGFLVVGHDEYWSSQQRQRVEEALNRGVNLGFFGANAMYWQIRYEASRGGTSRIIVAYKDDAMRDDPMRNSSQVTNRFRTAQINRPEEMIVGSQYNYDTLTGDLVVADEASWILEGTDLHNGDSIPGLLGYEVDGRFGKEPAGTKTVFNSPYRNRAGNQLYSTMTTYEKGTATVVNTGSMQWSWGLDEFPSATATDLTNFWRPGLVNPAITTATRNILQKFGAK